MASLAAAVGKPTKADGAHTLIQARRIGKAPGRRPRRGGTFELQYPGVFGLRKEGIWRGKAMKDGLIVIVTLGLDGNVTARQLSRRAFRPISSSS